MKALEFTATGIKKINVQKNSSQNLKSKVSYKFGRYFLVMKRPLTTPDTKIDIQLQPGQTTPIAFNLWNGSTGETGSKKVISSWFDMILE
jgi:DMSO reductase family type II enzyme heme b subunit